MKTLVLLRHGESLWNKENKFTGWTDVDLSEAGKNEAENAGLIMKAKGLKFDIAFTSVLKRANHTLDIALDKMGQKNIKIIKSWKLNERHYGALQGMNKSEMAVIYGEEQIHIWRRSYSVRPPSLDLNDERNPSKDILYADVSKKLLPRCESLKDTVARVIPYYKEEILPKIKSGKRVIIAAHGNSLRALVMYFENLSEDEISKVNIPMGIPLVYEFDDNMKLHKKYYLGDEKIISSKMKAVAEQGLAIR